MLKVETLINERIALNDKLQKKKQKWLTSDSKFKERKATFQDLFRTSLQLITSVCQADEASKTHSITEHEKALLMIDDVFIQNRLRSQQFTGEVMHQIDIKKELLNDLG